jgi:hypothetical protein
MVRASLQYYYTFKVVSSSGEPLKVEAHKWEEETGDHSGTTYTVEPEKLEAWLGQCSCPAYRKCKHIKCVEEVLQDGRIYELWKWRWNEKHGWSELKDIQPIEELDT